VLLLLLLMLSLLVIAQLSWCCWVPTPVRLPELEQQLVLVLMLLLVYEVNR